MISPRPPVSTLCTGQAASMGSLLLCAGEKDMRFTLPNSRIMVHQPSGGFQGQATDIMLHAQEILNLKKRLNEIYVKHTGQPDRKSTRLNSSHLVISYAVFCLKKKKVNTMYAHMLLQMMNTRDRPHI